MPGNSPQKTVIPQSKVKLLLALLGCLAFVYMGYELYNINEPSKHNTPMVKFWAVVGILFFGAGALKATLMFFRKNAVMTIDKGGITDNTSARKIGPIEWKDITGISVRKEHSIKFLVLATNGLSVSLHAILLKCTFKELEKTVRSYYEKYEKKTTTN